MTKLDWITVWAGLIAGAVVICYGTVTSIHYQDQRVRQLARELMEREAVLSGHADWKPGDHGEPVFYWRPCQ